MSFVEKMGLEKYMFHVSVVSVCHFTQDLRRLTLKVKRDCI